MKGRKVDAFEMNNTFSSMPKDILNRQAIHLLTRGDEYLIHQVGVIRLYQMHGIVLSINSESLFMKFFDTESEAIDYYLDQFKGTRGSKQQNLLNP